MQSCRHEDSTRPNRKQLVAILTEDPTKVLPEGTQLVTDPNAPTPVPVEGRVTSSYWSAALDRSIALALINVGVGLSMWSVMGMSLILSRTFLLVGSTALFVVAAKSNKEVFNAPLAEAV